MPSGAGTGANAAELVASTLRPAVRPDDKSGTLPVAERPFRILIISGSDRRQYNCPGVDSKSRTLMLRMAERLPQEWEIDYEDLGNVYGRARIQSCNACVSTSMALCVWPCNCYEKHDSAEPDLMWDLDMYSRLGSAAEQHEPHPRCGRQLPQLCLDGRSQLDTEPVPLAAIQPDDPQTVVLRSCRRDPGLQFVAAPENDRISLRCFQRIEQVAAHARAVLTDVFQLRVGYLQPQRSVRATHGCALRSSWPPQS